MLPGLLTLAVLSLLNGLALLVSYVANNSFPKPLSEQEENDYIALALTGDESAKKVLVERNLRLVAHIIKKFDGEDFDDLVSIGQDIQSNILVTLMLKEMGVKRVVAKAATDLQGKVLQKIGADIVVFPERDMGERVARWLISRNIIDATNNPAVLNF